MLKGRKSIYCVFDEQKNIDRAVFALKSSGFSNADISVLIPQRIADGADSTKSPEGAALGTGAGVALGGALGWLVGAGTIILNPLLAPFIAAGPLMSALAGAGLGGVVGGLSGALAGAGFPEHEAKHYESALEQGSGMLVVHVKDAEASLKAQEILKMYDAKSLSRTEPEANHDRAYCPAERELSGDHLLFP